MCRRAFFPALLGAVVLVNACAGRAPDGRDRSSDSASISVGLDEFALIPEADSVEAGRVRFEVVNAGSADHNFSVIRTDLASGGLPLDGAQVDEESGRTKSVGRIRLIKAGETRSLNVELQRGNYVLICNVPGHYRLGMRASLDVK